jgi:hypothetical protein
VPVALGLRQQLALVVKTQCLVLLLPLVAVEEVPLVLALK